MKKLLLLFVTALTVMACSSDDDTPPPTQDPIIGTWKYFKYFENGVEQTLDPCEPEDTLIFAPNNDYTAQFFIEINGECVVDETITSVWSNEGNGLYGLLFNGVVETEMITFDGNTFYIEYTDDLGTTDPSDDILERDVFIRQ